MKKILLVILCVILMFSTTVFAEYTVDDAYADFNAEHPDTVNDFITYGVSEETIISFLNDMYSYILETHAHTPVTKDNFENVALTAISRVSSREKYYSLQDALLILYPDAIRMAVSQGAVSDDLRPVVDTVKKIIFENNMLGFSESSTTGTGSNSGTGSESDSLNNTIVSFTDLPVSHWAFTPITSLAENFILNGYLDGTFKPDANITRGEFAKIIVSVTNCLDVSATSSFSDVSSDDWYYYHVSSALKSGFITGYPDGTFRPNDNITRADICTIVSRSLGSPGSVSGSIFSDDRLIPSYAKVPVYSLVKKGVINGMGNGTFAPKAFATRAQTAKIIYNAFFE